MPDEYEYFTNKHPDRTYISKPFEKYDEPGVQVRFASKVFDSPEQHNFARIKNEVVLRVVHNQRWEIKALFYEDTRDIKCITIQRFTVANGNPHKSSFTFCDNEVAKLYDFLRSVKYIDLSDEEKQRLNDQELKNLLLSVDEKKEFLLDNVELIVDVLKNDLSTSEIVALAHRKQQLEVFGCVLNELRSDQAANFSSAVEG